MLEPDESRGSRPDLRGEFGNNPRFLPDNSSFVRLKNRCIITNRPKGYFRAFGLSRQVLREMTYQCLLPGVKKSSW